MLSFCLATVSRVASTKVLGFRFLTFYFNAGQALGLSVPMSTWIATNANITFEVWNETAFT